MPTYETPTVARKSPILGIIGMGIVVVAAVIFFILSLGFYNTVFEIWGPELLSGADPSSLTREMIEEMSARGAGPIAGMMGISVVGIIGWVLSIVATVQNKGRIFGIIGIVAGIIAPFLFVIAAGVAGAAYGY